MTVIVAVCAAFELTVSEPKTGVGRRVLADKGLGGDPIYLVSLMQPTRYIQADEQVYCAPRRGEGDLGVEIARCVKLTCACPRRYNLKVPKIMSGKYRTCRRPYLL